jgi:hypothetical protein
MLSGLSGLTGVSGVCGEGAAVPPPFDPETAAAVVSGSAMPVLNITYPRAGSLNGRGEYFGNGGSYRISWTDDAGGYWQFTNDVYSTVYYYATQDVAFPWLVTVWEVSEGSEPVPTVTAA